MKKIIALAACIVALASCSTQNSSDSVDIVGKWSIEKAVGVSTETGANPAFINFEKDGKMNGHTSVNLFHGTYKLEGNKLTLSDIGMTMMMGPSMDVEEAVTKAINTTASIKTEDGKAYVFNEKNDAIMVLKK